MAGEPLWSPGELRRGLLLGAWAVSILATLGSLNFSGIPPLGWYGMHLVPCDLCWYQRILMYPLTILLGYAALDNRDQLEAPVLVLAAVGMVTAAYHSLIQRFPGLESGQCSTVSCGGIQYQLGPLTIPNLSLIAFLLITALVATALWRRSAYGQ